MSELQAIDLDSRYAGKSGPALLSGIQALVRLTIEQRRLDAERGLKTGAYISGYPGSPLGGLDRELERAREHLKRHAVVFSPGVNEELAATAVAGTQRVPELPGRSVDGVVGFWYGKAPGLDRAADAIRHGNVSGTSHLGGAVALIGDDPWCKSSTLPSSSESMAESLVLPLLAPACVEDIVRLGLHAVAISRAAGLWTALKIISDVADSSATVHLEDLRGLIPHPPPSGRGPAPTLLGASSVAAEHSLFGERLEHARDYGREHQLNRIVFEPRSPRIAIVAPGPAFATLERSLEQLSLDAPQLDRLGIRLVRLELVWPLHPKDALEFAAGVEQLLVIEDKRAFVERQLRDHLNRAGAATVVIGKHDTEGRSLVPMKGAVDSETLTRVLVHVGKNDLPARGRSSLDAEGTGPPDTRELPIVRTPFFCPGCPHNLSTRASTDQLVGAGIGCHSLVALDPAHARGRLLGAPQMGGEGAQWLGMAPFTTEAHYLQNIGDGTFHHSGSLAIRAAVAAGANITYRLLYNDAIAMTGGQMPPGRIDVVPLTHWLELEGVRRVIITSEEPKAFERARLAPIAEVRSRSELETLQQELSTVEGVTVIIHTDRCAAEERRLRKRGALATPTHRVWINERVCEGCGDCGKKSSCLSVVPTQTEFGRKTSIHQSSCTQDFACLEGDCPSFVMIVPGSATVSAPPPEVPIELPDPTPRVDSATGFLLRMPGIGGTGVVTVSQILQMAALLEGKWASGLDQTGLAQKGGAVISDVRIAGTRQKGSLRAGRREVDVLLGLDLIGIGTPETLNTLDPAKTIAVVNSHAAATIAAVTDPDASSIRHAALMDRLSTATRAEDALWVNAGDMAQRLFGDHMLTNMIMLGAAYQHGCIPVSQEAIVSAIRLNGVAVRNNLIAFDWGRAVVTDPTLTDALLTRPEAEPPALPAELASLFHTEPLEEGLREVITRRAADLVAYQHVQYARAYVEAVTSVFHAEREAMGAEATALTDAYARGLHKLMAYKDEYEVARLHLDETEKAKREQTFGPNARVEILVHPPLLRLLGLKRKLRLRRSARPLFTLLRAARRVRGTPLDPFGHTHIRRTERALVGQYRTLVTSAVRELRVESYDTAVAIATLPDLVRGYEQIKLDSIDRFRREADRLAGELGGPAPSYS